MQDDTDAPRDPKPPDPEPTNLGVIPASLKEGTVVVIRAFDDIPEHLFKVVEVYDNCVSGHSKTGPLAGEYGEPEFALIKSVHCR